MKRKPKNLLFLVAVLLFFFLIFEGGVRILKVKVIQDEPYFFGFNGRPDYYIKKEKNNKEVIFSSNPQKIIADITFTLPKPDKTYRIFTLGGSAVYGEPYGNGGSFSYWLEHRLSIMYNDINFEVINCGRKGFGSVRVKNIFDEIIAYQPDLILFYFGNNEWRDIYFHKNEINIEIRPFFKTVKRVLDNSYIFRMFFYLFFKEKVVSFGAEQLKGAAENREFSKDIFKPQLDRINRIKNVLDKKYGGRWESKLNSTSITDDFENSERYRPIMNRIKWHPKLERVFEYCVSHIIKRCKKEEIPVVFITRSTNFYYNKDYRILFEKYDPASKIIEKQCSSRNVLYIKSLSVLLKEFNNEIGYNAFMDFFHPTIAANQMISRAVAYKIVNSNLIEQDVVENIDEIEKRIFKEQTIRRENFSVTSEALSLHGWQKLVCHGADQMEKEIVDLGERAKRMDKENPGAYLLLGTMYTLKHNYSEAENIWKEMVSVFKKE